MTDRYAVIGNPIAHSKSPRIHAAFARQCGQDIVYDAILAPRGGFAPAVAEFRDGGGRGLNVTVPFKLEAHALATTLTERARQAEAVNTLKFEGAVALGDNTDGAGLVHDIRDRLGFPLANRRILLMGAGGAAHGVALPVLREGPAALCIVNRTLAKARALERHFRAYGPVSSAAYPSLAGQSFDVVINATSASMSEAVPPLPDGVFAPGCLAYDMVYGDAPTAFLRFALEHGATRVADGLGMLVAQAAESFHLWRGVRPDIAPVIAMLRGGAADQPIDSSA
jgi:shikimate dehydrogenase